MLQHGSADDNVPAFHSRRMNQLISQKHLGPPSPKYTELDGKGHWFDGVMTTPGLLFFYQNVLGGPLIKPEVPQTFSVVIADPGDMGSKYGLFVDQKLHPDRLGRVDAITDKVALSWSLQTSNISRFHIDTSCINGVIPRRMVIDSCSVRLPTESESDKFSFCRAESGAWQVR